MAAATAAEAVDAEVAEAENGRVRQLPALSRGGGGARVDGRATVRKGRGHVTPLRDASKVRKNLRRLQRIPYTLYETDTIKRTRASRIKTRIEMRAPCVSLADFYIRLYCKKRLRLKSTWSFYLSTGRFMNFISGREKAPHPPPCSPTK